MRNPKPQEWKTEDYSQKKIADYKAFNFVDGEGVRNSLYVSGCLFACEGCFNKAVQNFNYGTPFTESLMNQIIEDLSHDYVQGLTLLGGEPFLNTDVCLSVVKRVRETFGSAKDIWSWSGYTFEELLLETPDKLELLHSIDILVDGRFELAKRNFNFQFRGNGLLMYPNHLLLAKLLFGKNVMTPKRLMNKSKNQFKKVSPLAIS